MATNNEIRSVSLRRAPKTVRAVCRYSRQTPLVHGGKKQASGSVNSWFGSKLVRLGRAHLADSEPFFDLLIRRADVVITQMAVKECRRPDVYPPWSIIVGNALLAAAYGILWGGARKLDGKNVSILLALMGVVFWLIACSIRPIYARPEARATVMAAIGIVYTLLIVFELWRGRGDEVWRWPIMVLLLVHAAAIPIHIPLAGAWIHPDPSDLDLLTFAIFEGAIVCICAAYLFGGLAKDRIAAGYRRASLTDPLTGVANRRGFLHRGKRLLMRARFAREPTALILFDLDRFKSINDRYGHITGDEVLISFCRVVTSHLRPNDLFGRIGGEEFASLLPNTGRHDALWLAERVRKAFDASFHTTGQYAFSSTVSVGVAISDDEWSDLNALLSAADQALYRAKALGRNRVEPSPHWAERSTTERAIAI